MDSNNLKISIVLPDNWKVEENANVLSVYDEENGVGALQFSSYEADDTTSIDLKEELESYLSDRHEEFSVQRMDKYAFCKCEDDQGNGWKYWVYMKKNTITFVSYNCSKADIEKESKEVEAIVKSAIESNAWVS